MKLLAPLIALSLSACFPSGLFTAPASPAPLAQTVIDDKALLVAWKSFDVALDGINVAMDFCEGALGSSISKCAALKPGSPSANRLADAIDKVTGFLTAAEKAAVAGSAADYRVALANAMGALTDLRAALKG